MAEELVVDALFRWIVVGAFLVASPFSVIGASEALQVNARLRQRERVRGSVVSNHLVVTRADGNEEHSYQPEVSFHSRDGVEHRFTDGVGSLPPDYQIGEPVEVIYASSRPAEARIASWERLWLAPTLLIAVGLFPGLVTWLVLWRVARSSA